MMGKASTGQAPRLLGLVAEVSPGDYTIEAESCSLGRHASCDVMVTRALISRLHAQITREGLRYVLSDAGSRNGTFVNGRRIAGPHLLTDDDVIGLGTPEPQIRFIDPDPTELAPPAAPPAQVARLHYDAQTIRFFLDGQALELTLMQMKLLSHLYRHAGSVCTRESCAEALWGRDYQPGVDAGALDQVMTGLRQALARVAPDASLIQTRRGLGYLLSLG